MVKSSGLQIISTFLLCHLSFTLSLSPSESQNEDSHSWWHLPECQCPEGEMVSPRGPKETALLTSTGQTCPPRGEGLPLRTQMHPSLREGHFL